MRAGLGLWYGRMGHIIESHCWPLHNLSSDRSDDLVCVRPVFKVLRGLLMVGNVSHNEQKRTSPTSSRDRNDIHAKSNDLNTIRMNVAWVIHFELVRGRQGVHHAACSWLSIVYATYMYINLTYRLWKEEHTCSCGICHDSEIHAETKRTKLNDWKPIGN